ncbi:hypothetical protein [Thiohalorhabdus sp.]|uniref:hypothetical protein n=1 Tax=Thiohalorhabdus sp. TaxID=3094134 RepID=UPI002FC2DA71
MSNLFEVKGYLFQGARLVSLVHHPLRWNRDGWGRATAEGELLMLADRGEGLEGEDLILHTADGLSLTLELAGKADGGWWAFRRLARKEAAHGQG